MAPATGPTEGSPLSQLLPAKISFALCAQKAPRSISSLVSRAEGFLGSTLKDEVDPYCCMERESSFTVLAGTAPRCGFPSPYLSILLLKPIGEVSLWDHYGWCFHEFSSTYGHMSLGMYLGE